MLAVSWLYYTLGCWIPLGIVVHRRQVLFPRLKDLRQQAQAYRPLSEQEKKAKQIRLAVQQLEGEACKALEAFCQTQ